MWLSFNAVSNSSKLPQSHLDNRHSIGNGEVDSSILSGSTIQINELGKGIAEVWALTGHFPEMLSQATLCRLRYRAHRWLTIKKARLVGGLHEFFLVSDVLRLR